MLRVGETAPDFDLASTSGLRVNLESLKGRRVVLYFYPRDSTPGCTQEACDFRDAHVALDAVVLGVSADSLGSHDKFRDKHQLPFDLLTDPGNAVARRYGAYGDKNMYGRTVKGTIRSTFLIGPTGQIEAIWSPVRVKGHVDQVLGALSGGGAPAKKATAKKVTKKKATKKKATKKKATKKKATAKKATKKKATAKKATKKKATAKKATKKKATAKKATKKKATKKKATKKKATKKKATKKKATKKKAAR